MIGVDSKREANPTLSADGALKTSVSHHRRGQPSWDSLTGFVTAEDTLCALREAVLSIART